jgi:hypothetical protein
MPKLPRTLRLDASDTFVFEHPAEPGEWAVTGSFRFWDQDVTALQAKARAAFRAGFVGVDSLGFSTLVTVAEASELEREAAVEALAGHLLRDFGAPDRAAARAAAQEEIAFAASLCDHPVGTVLALHRTLEGGAISEQFRTLRPRDPASRGADRLHAHARAFTIVETDEEPEERVDLVELMGPRPGGGP